MTVRCTTRPRRRTDSAGDDPAARGRARSRRDHGLVAQTEWLGLDILDTVRGGEDDDEGIVTVL
ncbi:MAG TPA: hypothetical protein VHT91_03885 [Kofleriaceae bacterium]|nr:hypothetical protein [Kofleriaceae bacterium]